MIKIYTKNYCPFCAKAKVLLDSLGVKYDEDDVTDSPEKIQELSKLSGMMTVPQIFVGEKCLGGYSDIEKLHQEGKLEELLKG
jgi:glutaredoxin 3